MHAAGFPRPAPPSKLREKISRTPQYWRPSNWLMQISIQTCINHEAKPGDGGTDDRCQAPLTWNSTDELQGRSVMEEEWGSINDRELVSFRAVGADQPVVTSDSPSWANANWLAASHLRQG